MSASLVPTILLVDDDPWALAIMKGALSNSGWRVISSSDPMKALPMIEWEGVDVIVSDISMPSVSGVDLVVRARQLFPAVTRILVSGHASLDHAMRAINEAEVYRLLTKPIDAIELREAVGKAVALAAERRQAAELARVSAARENAKRDLELRYPGLLRPPSEPGVHLLSAARLDEVGQRLKQFCAGTPLESLLG